MGEFSRKYLFSLWPKDKSYDLELSSQPPFPILSLFLPLDIVIVLGAAAATFWSEVTSSRKRGNMTMTEQEDVKNLDHEHQKLLFLIIIIYLHLYGVCLYKKIKRKKSITIVCYILYLQDLDKTFNFLKTLVSLTIKWK